MGTAHNNRMITLPALTGLAGIKHGFSTRQNGVSEGVYKSLNCGPGSDDNPAHVAQNRQLVLDQLGMPDADLLTLYQVHSPNVVVVDKPWPVGEQPKADGMTTCKPGVVLGVLSADCTPVLFADAKAGVIGACHAGWKGALSGVMEATVASMVSQGAQAANIVAAIGPCIHQESYEVGPEFLESFTVENTDHAAFFVPSVKEGHHMFDLPGFIGSRLAKLNLADVVSSGCDTCSDEQQFFSYRRKTHRNEPDYGRMISVIALLPSAGGS